MPRIPRDGLLLALLVLLHCALFESGLGGSDGWGYFANVESLLEDHDLDLADNLSPRGRQGILGEVGTSDGRLGGMPHPDRPGRVVNSYPLGKVVLDAPFYLVGKAAGKAAGGRLQLPGLAGTPYEGLSPGRLLCVLGVVFGSNVYAALAVCLTFLALLRCGLSRPVAWASAFLAFVASPLPYYAVNGMSHAAATAVSAGLLALWADRTREGRRLEGGDVFVFGLLAAAAFSLRYASAALLPVLGLLMLWEARGGRVKAAMLYTAGAACLLWIEPLRNWLEYGSPTRTLYPPLSESWVWLSPGLPWVDYFPLLNLFLSGRHGILAWSPLLGLAMAGLFAGRGRKGIRLMAWALFLGQAILPAIGGSYHAGSGFSQRYLCESMPVWALGIGFLLESAQGRRRRLAWGFGILAAWNYGLFLLTHAKLCRLSPETGTREGWEITDYLEALDRHLGPAGTVRRILDASVPGQLGHPGLALLGMLCGAGLFWALLRTAPAPRRP